MATLWVPKGNPFLLASFMIEPQYIDANNNETYKNHEVIYRTEDDQRV